MWNERYGSNEFAYGTEPNWLLAENAKLLTGPVLNLVADLATYQPPADFYGSVVSISAHLPRDIRRRLYPLVEQCLKRGGIILLEAYSKLQLSRNTGGPKEGNMLMTAEDIQKEFPNCQRLLCHEIEREVVEGEFHTGLASVVQFIGKKKN